MNRKTLSGLLALNLALIVGLFVTGGPSPTPAQAQFGGGPSYVMIAGDNKANDRDVIYILNLANGELRAIQYSDKDDRLSAVARRNILQDVASRGGGSR